MKHDPAREQKSNVVMFAEAISASGQTLQSAAPPASDPEHAHSIGRVDTAVDLVSRLEDGTAKGGGICLVTRRPALGAGVCCSLGPAPRVSRGPASGALSPVEERRP